MTSQGGNSYFAARAFAIVWIDAWSASMPAVIVVTSDTVSPCLVEPVAGSSGRGQVLRPNLRRRNACT